MPAAGATQALSIPANVRLKKHKHIRGGNLIMKKYQLDCSVLKMIRGSIFHNFLFALIFMLLLIGCQYSTTPDGNVGEDGNDGIENHLSKIEGTWQDTESSRSFTINNIHVLFQNPNSVPPGETVTYGNFQYAYYDGTTVSIYDYDDEIVSFTATIENDILTISGLNTIKIFDDPYDPRDYRPWNTTYTK